jgi:large subunit ribosomal protein L5
MSTTTYTPRLKAHYRNVVREDLMKQLGVSNPMQVPTMEKIVINMGVGKATQQASLLDGAVADLTAITGQKPIVTKSRIAIASFKLRENQAIGAKVTLRGDRMWEFFDRLLSVAIPRIRDFRGLPGRSWDGNGNYTFGLTEQLVFTEINYDRVDVPRGMDITIVTSAKDDLSGKALLDAFGFPFRKGEMPASTKRMKKQSKKKSAVQGNS